MIMKMICNAVEEIINVCVYHIIYVHFYIRYEPFYVLFALFVLGVFVVKVFRY